MRNTVSTRRWIEEKIILHAYTFEKFASLSQTHSSHFERMYMRYAAAICAALFFDNLITFSIEPHATKKGNIFESELYAIQIANASLDRIANSNGIVSVGNGQLIRLV